MKCTECSQPIRPVVALDIDNTLSDYSGSLLGFADGYLALGRGRELVRRYKGGSLREHMDIDAHTYRQMKVAYRQGGGKRIQRTMPGAVLLCVAIKQCDVELWLTTTRPYLKFDSTDPDTRFWLDVNGFKYDHLLYEDDKYERLVEIVGRDRICAVLDDDVAQCYTATELGLTVTQAGSQYNSDEDWVWGSRVEGLTEAGWWILDRIAAWKEKHE